MKATENLREIVITIIILRTYSEMVDEAYSKRLHKLTNPAIMVSRKGRSEKMMNTAIYIDFDNVYIMLEKYYEKGSDILRTEIINKVKQEFSTEKIITFKAFADFNRIYEIINKLQKSQVELRHIYSSNGGRKNASDIGLTIDVIKSLFIKQDIDKYVIVSSDSDMLPIINELRFHGKEVFVIYSDVNSKSNYNEYLNNGEYKSIEQILSVSEYTKINEFDFLRNDLLDVLNDINDIIIRIHNKYKVGTTSMKDLKSELWKLKKHVKQNIDEYVNNIMNKDYLVEDNINGSSYKSVYLNETKLKADGIALNSPVTIF